MSSTEFTIGLKEGGRSSSKVLKPPGGGSSNIFGDCGSSDDKSRKNIAEAKQAPLPPAGDVRSFGTSLETNVPRSATKTHMQRNPITGYQNELNLHVADEEDEKNVIRNPITGEIIRKFPKLMEDKGNQNVNQLITPDETVKEKEKDRKTKPVITTSIRVKNPPGGKSTGIF